MSVSLGYWTAGTTPARRHTRDGGTSPGAAPPQWAFTAQRRGTLLSTKLCNWVFLVVSVMSVDFVVWIRWFGGGGQEGEREKEVLRGRGRLKK